MLKGHFKYLSGCALLRWYVITTASTLCTLHDLHLPAYSTLGLFRLDVLRCKRLQWCRSRATLEEQHFL